MLQSSCVARFEKFPFLHSGSWILSCFNFKVFSFAWIRMRFVRAAALLQNEMGINLATFLSAR